MALLTPKDIREHTFQTVRFKEGMTSMKSTIFSIR